MFVLVPVWAEISSRRPSGPATRTGGASPLCTITTCSRAASWWSCSPSSSTCCGCGAFTGGPRAVARPPPSGWRTAFRPRRSPAPYEPEFEPQKDSNGKAIFASGFLLFILICFVFPFPFRSLKQNQNPLFLNSAVLEALHLAVLCPALSCGIGKREHHFIFAA